MGKYLFFRLMLDRIREVFAEADKDPWWQQMEQLAQDAKRAEDAKNERR